MSSVAYVERAQRMARFVEDDEFRVTGDRDVARAQLARRHGLGARFLYALRYCPPKVIAVNLYEALCDAVEESAARQIRELEHEIAEARAGRLGRRPDFVEKAEKVISDARALLDGDAK